jgi:hypothetical protein
MRILGLGSSPVDAASRASVAVASNMCAANHFTYPEAGAPQGIVARLYLSDEIEREFIDPQKKRFRRGPPRK